MRIPKSLNLLLYIIGIIAFQEIVLRICFPIPEIENFNRINYQPGIKPSKSDYLRNIKMLWKSSLDTSADFVHDLNYYGFRDYNWKIGKSKNKQRILFIGDSFVEGMTSDGENVISNGFKNKAEAMDLEVEAMNFGIMGIGLNEFMHLIVDVTPVFMPDYVFLVLCYNDMPFNNPYFPKTRLNPKYSNLMRPRILELIDMLIRKEPLPIRWSFNTKRFYPAVPSKNNPWTFFADSLIKQVRPDVARAMRKGEFNFFRTNWVLQEERFLRTQTNVESKLSMLNEYVKDLNSRLIVFYLPSRHQLSNYYYQFERHQCLSCPVNLDLTHEKYHLHRKILQTNCSNLSIPYYDLTKEMQIEEDRGRHLYWNYDDHMRGSTYIMLGEKMFDWWNNSL